MRQITHSIVCLLPVMALLLASCHSMAYGPGVEEALASAGDNRPELEKVLRHYQNDSLRLAAAEYLIAHMPGHYTFADTADVVGYSHRVDTIMRQMREAPHEAIRDSVNQAAQQWHMAQQRKVYDVRHLKASFLISNIDQAMLAWQKGPWARHLSFSQFCEWLLPYKVDELQLLDNWRTRLKPFLADNLHELDYCDPLRLSAFAACKLLNDNMHQYMQPDHATTLQHTTMKIETAASIPFGTCDHYAVIASAVFRCHGLPVARDFTPQWAFRSSGHSWNVLLASDGRHIPFSGVCTTPGDAHKIDEKMPRAYRHTYAANERLVRLNQHKGYVPPLFRNVFVSEVTNEYISTSDITLSLDTIPDDGYAYLAVFDDKGWSPVAYARMDGRRASFEHMGQNILYLPVGYDARGRQKVLGRPFVLGYDGGMTVVQADRQHRQRMVLRRKYPTLEYVYEWLNRLEGGRFEASNDARFSHVFPIHTITDCHAYGYEVRVSDTIPPCRYWRYTSHRPAGFCNMAEMYFFDAKADTLLRGQVVGTEGSWGDNPEKCREAAADGDELTFFDAPDPDHSWVGLDFGRPVKVGRLCYVGRGDGNNVCLGDTYQLMVFNGTGWTSLGSQKAAHPYLTFDGVPSGGLYLLKNLSRGKDERVFTYEKGRQVWW